MEQRQSEIKLDDKLQQLLDHVTTGEIKRQIELQGMASLSGEERSRIAIALMRNYNKVTHIYELVKAYESTSQVEYNRSKRLWERVEQISAKHEFELAVNPLNGLKVAGDDHAPLVYAQDPRSDVPADLQSHLSQLITDCDDRIVSGWMVN